MRPLGPEREIGAGTVRYLDLGHAREGGHLVALAGREVTVLPDGRTTARQRSHALTAALNASPDPVADLVGTLILIGVSNLAVDGVPIAVGESVDRLLASLRLELTQNDAGVQVRVVETGGVG